jgi:nucleotide-binding universal stress UspA family protein
MRARITTITELWGTCDATCSGMRILIAIDRSEYSEIVVEHGLDQAVRLGASELHFVTVVTNAVEMEATRTWLTEVARDALETFHCRADVTLHVRCGIPAVAIASVAIEITAGLIVVGRFRDSVSAELLELTEYPTLVVGIDGPVLEPQCPACGRARMASNGLFCEAHHDDVLPDLATRVPPSFQGGSRLW